MKTYKQVIKREGEIALSQGFSGEGTEPKYHRVDMIAHIYERDSESVRLDIIAARDTPETYQRVSGRPYYK